MGERNGETFVRRMHQKKMREQERGEKGSVKASATNKAKSGLARGFTLVWVGDHLGFAVRFLILLE